MNHLEVGKVCPHCGGLLIGLGGSPVADVRCMACRRGFFWNACRRQWQEVSLAVEMAAGAEAA